MDDMYACVYVCLNNFYIYIYLCRNDPVTDGMFLSSQLGRFVAASTHPEVDEFPNAAFDPEK